MRMGERERIIRQLIPDFSGPEISELLDIPLDTVRDICKLAGIKMPRGPRRKHKPKYQEKDYSSFPSRRYAVSGTSPCFVPGGIRKEGDKIETHGPVRILIQNGKRV